MFGPQDPTGAVFINPARYIYSFNRVFQKFVPIVNCILRKAFNASLSKCKLIPVRIYLNNRSKQFQTKICRNYNIFEVLRQMCTYASFFPPYFSCPFCRFSTFVFFAVFFYFLYSFTKKAYTVCAKAEASIFFWFSGQTVKDIVKLLTNV